MFYSIYVDRKCIYKICYNAKSAPFLVNLI